MKYVLFLVGSFLIMADISMVTYPFSVTHLAISAGLHPFLAFAVAFLFYGIPIELIHRRFLPAGRKAKK